MQIAVLGAGSVGGNLGRGWAAAGHDVVFGVRDPRKPNVRELVGETDGDATDPVTAAGAADVAVLAVPGDAAESVAGSVADALGDTPLIDATNRLDRSESVGTAVAAAIDGPYAKAFNTVGAEWFDDPDADGTPASMFVCGDPAAKEAAATLAADLGFDVVDAGDASAVVVLEDLARAWIHLSGRHGRDVAFRLLRR